MVDTESFMVSEGIGCQQHDVDSVYHPSALLPPKNYSDLRRFTKFRSQSPERNTKRNTSETPRSGAAMEHNRGSAAGVPVWRRSISKLSATVKRQLACKSLADEEEEYEMGVSHLHDVPNAILLDYRDDEPEEKLEQVRLSLVGLTPSSDESLDLPTIDNYHRTASASWDIRATELGMGSQDTGEQSGAPLGIAKIDGSEESIDILEEHDELQSGRYSGVLESLRSKLLDNLSCVTEEMLSRAIINEFASNSNGYGDDGSCSSPRSTLGKREGDNTEADHLFDLLHHWLSKQANVTSAEYFQQSLCKIMHQIRAEELHSADQAYAIAHTLAVSLGLHQDRLGNVVLIQLPKKVSRASLFDEFSYFGKVLALGVSRKQPLFAFCRFSNETSVAGVLSCRDQGAILIRGRIRPKLQSLTKLLRSRQQRLPARQPQDKCFRRKIRTAQTSREANMSSEELAMRRSAGPSLESPTSVVKDIHSSIFR